MKKIIAILFFTLAAATVKVNAQTSSYATTQNLGVIESISDNGTGTIRDIQTGQLKTFLTRDGEFHREGAFIVGTPVTYMEITLPTGKVIVNDIKTGHM